MHAMTGSNAVSGFQATGIFPVNSRISLDEAYAPSAVTERREEGVVATAENGSSSIAVPPAEETESITLAYTAVAPSSSSEPEKDRLETIRPKDILRIASTSAVTPRKKTNTGMRAVIT